MLDESKLQEIHKLSQGGLLRIKDVLQFVPVSRSCWWAGCRSGKFPKPVKLSERVTCWRASDIWAFIEQQGKVIPNRG
jgi:prophage regulatory protein